MTMLNTTLRNGLMLSSGCALSSCMLRKSPLARSSAPTEANQPWPADRFLVLAYHDVEDDAADQRYLSVRTSALNEQIAWLLHNGYHAISVQDILDAHYGLKSLPPKAFLLSFDDGYSSFYTRVWPLLKAWNVPALWAPVGSWVDTPTGQPVNFGGLMTPRERFRYLGDGARAQPLAAGGDRRAHLGLALRSAGQSAGQPRACRRQPRLG